MNLKAILNVVGILLLLLSVILIVPLGVSYIYPTPALENHFTVQDAFWATLILSGVCGLVLWKGFPTGIEKLRDREGFAIVAFSWVSICVFGSLPYYLTGVCPHYVDAFFETMSGFTTTGASIFTDIDAIPKGILFWRNLTQWLGGMGIIMLSLAIFPALGIGSIHLFKSEVPGGSTVERMQPRLAETAKVLWKVYLVLTLAEFLLLRLGGLSYFDAICHTFSTVATGGFSPHQASIAEFNSVYVETVVIVFMILGGINFSLHYKAVHNEWSDIFKNTEFKVYLLLITVGVLVATWGLWHQAGDQHLGESFRKATFTIVSINTTTGFVTDDFDRWPDFLRILLVIIMMIGGCAGSTSGSLKCIRIIILARVIFREFQKLVHPRAVIRVKVGEKTVESDHVMNVISLTFLFLGVTVISSILLSLMGLDMTTAITASIASLFNIGPGLGMVGATGSYAEIPILGKWILILWMLMGRLEVYGVMLLFLPIAWRK